MTLGQVRWYKRWYCWDGRGALELSLALAEMDSTFVDYCEKDGYQRRLILLLAVVHRFAEVLSVVLPDLFALPEDLGCLYYVTHRLYWTCKSFFESHVRQCPQMFGEGHNVDVFSMELPDRDRSYCIFSSWLMKMKYESCPCCSLLHRSYWLIIAVSSCEAPPRNKYEYGQLR